MSKDTTMLLKTSPRWWTMISRFMLLPYMVLFGGISLRSFWHHNLGFGCGFGAVTIVAFLAHWFIARRIVLVSFTESGLQFTDWFRHASVSWESVGTVRRVRWLRGQPYMITLRTRTVFGSRVLMVMPFSEAKREDLLGLFRARVAVDEAYA